jgi:hypothetical protein
VTTLCEDCPPVGYPTDKTRCGPCPRKVSNAAYEPTACLGVLATDEPCKTDLANLRRCTICGFIVDVRFEAAKPDAFGVAGRVKT